LLLKEKQLKLPEGCKFPTTQELQGRLFCKWHNSFTHGTSDCKELRRQIQSAIEQGRLILGQHAMKVDTQPFPSVNMVEDTGRTARHQLDFAFGINMVGPARCRDEKKKRADPCNRPHTGERIILLRNKSDTSVINDQFLLIFSENMSTSISSVADMSRKKKNTSGILERA
jgi:hypothetical protein